MNRILVVCCYHCQCCCVDNTSPECPVTGLSPGWVDPDVDWLYISISRPQPGGTRASTRSPPMTGRSERCTSDLMVIQFRVRMCYMPKEIEPKESHTHTHTRLTTLFPGLSGWAGTRKVKPTWIILKQETVSGSGISWAICKSAPCSRLTTAPAPHHWVFTGRMPFLPPIQQHHSTEGN